MVYPFFQKFNRYLLLGVLITTAINPLFKHDKIDRYLLLGVLTTTTINPLFKHDKI